MERALAEELKSAAQGKGVSCPGAWDIAKKHKVARKVVGQAMDSLEIRILDCQMRCFGASKATHQELAGKQPEEPIRSAILAHLDDGRLPCAVAHALARRLKVSPGQVGDTATLMSVHISRCQLGCF